MQIFKLTIIRIPADSQGDLIHRTHTIKAQSLADAELSSTVAQLVNTMDNVIDWHARIA